MLGRARRLDPAVVNGDCYWLTARQPTDTEYTVMQIMSCYAIVLTVSVSPDEDRMLLQYVRPLTASERQFLNMT